MDVTKAVATMQGGSLAEFLRENPDQGILLGIIIVLIFAVAFLAWCACVGKWQKRAAALEHERCIQLCELSNECFFQYDIKKDRICFSGYGAQKLGYEPRIDHASSLLEQAEWDKTPETGMIRYLTEVKEDSQELRARLLRGETRWYQITKKLVVDEKNRPVYVVGKITDIQQLMEEKERWADKARKDGLTGLYHPTASRDFIQNYLDGRGNKGAFLIIDIDHFKGVNDRLGHLAGDQVLMGITQILQQIFRKGDIIGRLGGDEFVLCIYDCPDKGEIDSIIKDITADQDGYTVALDDHVEITVHFSMGYALYPEEGDNYHSLLELADERMYQNKKTRNGPLVR